MIDEKLLHRFGQWPWTRYYIDNLVDNLTAMGAATIGFNIIFAEPNRTSPARVVKDWGLSGLTNRALKPYWSICLITNNTSLRQSANRPASSV